MGEMSSLQTMVFIIKLFPLLVVLNVVDCRLICPFEMVATSAVYVFAE